MSKVHTKILLETRRKIQPHLSTNYLCHAVKYQSQPTFFGRKKFIKAQEEIQEYITRAICGENTVGTYLYSRTDNFPSDKEMFTFRMSLITEMMDYFKDK